MKLKLLKQRRNCFIKCFFLKLAQQSIHKQSIMCFGQVIVIIWYEKNSIKGGYNNTITVHCWESIKQRQSC